MWNAMRRQGGQDGYYALGRSIMASMLLGGLPLAATFKALYQKFADDDPYVKLKEKTGGVMGDWFTYGLPAAMGLNIHNSFDMDPPTSLEEIFGVPASMVKQAMNAKKSASLKDYRRAAEYAMPIKIVRDIMIAQRQYNQGLTTMSGQPISREGSREPMKITGSEAVRQGAGFPSLDVMKLRDIKESVRDLETMHQEKEAELATRYVNALRNNDQIALQDVIEEVNKWNTKYIKKGMPQHVIRLKDGIKARMKPAMPSKQMRPEARKMERTWMGD
jgi:hypothetical protein